MSTRYRRKAEVRAIKLPGPITVEGAKGPQTGRPGDYLVWDGDGDPFVLGAEAFERLYELADKPQPTYLPYPVYPAPPSYPWWDWRWPYPAVCGGTWTTNNTGPQIAYNTTAADSGVRINISDGPRVTAAQTYQLKS